jgi:hypothetical protein
MKNISYALAALATIAFAVPSVVIAQDAKKDEMKKEDGMKGDMKKMHHHHHHHHHHHKMMKKA